MRRINAAGIGIIKRFESLHDGDPSTPVLEPKLCPAGVWTVGWGHALVDRLGQHISCAPRREIAMARWRQLWPHGMTRADAGKLLEEDILRTEAVLSRVVRIPVSDNQWSALVSLTFNIGVGERGGRFDFADSKLLACLNRGDFHGASAQFTDWNLCKGVVVAGLTARRLAERDLFRTP